VLCNCVSAKGFRPSSAFARPADVDHLSTIMSHKQQNGSVGRQTVGGLSDSAGGLHRAVLYVLGEKTQMKVLVTSYGVNHPLSSSSF